MSSKPGKRMTVIKLQKLIVALFAVLISLSGQADAQAPANSRPTLDSFDLVTVNRAPAKAVRTIHVTQDIYKVLGPLMDLSRRLESDYRTTVIEKQRTVKSAEYLDWLSVKTLSVYRSMLIVKELDNVPDEVCDLLTNDHELILNIARVIGALRMNARNEVKKEIDALIAKYDVPTSQTRLDGSTITDIELLVDAMFRRLNADFARVTPFLN